MLVMRRRRLYYSIDSTHALEVVFSEVLEPDLLQEIFLPAFHRAVNTDGDIALFANHGAEAALLIASGKVLKSICQVIELAAIEELFRHVVFEPEHLGDLHLDAHCAAYIAQKIVFCSVDLFGLFHRPVIQP